MAGAAHSKRIGGHKSNSCWSPAGTSLPDTLNQYDPRLRHAMDEEICSIDWASPAAPPAAGGVAPVRSKL